MPIHYDINASSFQRTLFIEDERNRVKRRTYIFENIDCCIKKWNGVSGSYSVPFLDQQSIFQICSSTQPSFVSKSVPETARISSIDGIAAITSNDFIEYRTNPQRGIKERYRVLKWVFANWFNVVIFHPGETIKPSSPSMLYASSDRHDLCYQVALRTLDIFNDYILNS
ncbi:hypothetical protein Tco_1447999 [Tanacetum coccineum]